MPTRPPVGDTTPRAVRSSVTRTPAIELMGRGSGGTVTFALAKYSGDWDCDKTAMPNLAYQLERRVGVLLDTEAPTVPLTDPRLKRQPFLFISGHKDFRFSDAERRALRRYLQAGGSIWINDSTHEHDETFDRAVRRELARLLPDHPIVRLPKKHPVFTSCYDLSKGFKGYKVPPGDKYRCDYLEGVNLDGRTAVIYTRNDYGDGLEIDPNTAPLMPSLTDLSPRDMQEGSTRMGINIVLHFLGQQTGARDVEQIAREVQSHAARSERERREAVAAAEVTMLDNFDGEFGWGLEDGWGDEAEVAPVRRGATKRMSVRFKLGGNKKIAVSRDLLEQKDFSKHNALMVDFHSRLPAGCRVAVGLVTMPDWSYVESPPAYVRPGPNGKVIFRLDRPNFKSEESEWKYTHRPPNLDAVRKVVILIYPIRGGTIEVDNLRLAKLKPIPEHGK
jgi:hypothetical protein